MNKLRYLGSFISEDGRCLDNIKTRIGMAKDAFNKRKKLLTRSIRVSLRKRFVKTLVWPVVLYGCETWTMRTPLKCGCGEEWERLAGWIKGQINKY